METQWTLGYEKWLSLLSLPPVMSPSTISATIEAPNYFKFELDARKKLCRYVYCEKAAFEVPN